MLCGITDFLSMALPAIPVESHSDPPQHDSALPAVLRVLSPTPRAPNLR